MYKTILFFCGMVGFCIITAGDNKISVTEEGGYGDSYDTLADVARCCSERSAFPRKRDDSAIDTGSVDSYDSLTDVAREREEGTK